MLYQTHARVHLGNIHANLAGVRERVGANREILLAVKANAYGHGAVRISQMVQDTGVAGMLGVATVPEALELRAAGIRLPILKLSPAFPTELARAIEADVTFTVADSSHIQALQAMAVSLGARVRVHLKIDTGMGRIGATPAESVPLAELVVRRCPNLELEGVFTHMPVSDTPTDDEFTREQIALFARTVAEIEAATGRAIRLVHAANSGGILAHPDSWFTMVRPGLMAYGCYPDATTPRTVRLAPGLGWTSRVSYLKWVPAGTTLGYGRTWVAPRDTWIATIPVGYGDGYSRLLSNTGEVLIGGHRHRIAGRVTMDQTMVDLGPHADVRVGDEVVLVGSSGSERIDVEDLARLMGTIPYEVTCLISPRVDRVYSAVPQAALKDDADRADADPATPDLASVPGPHPTRATGRAAYASELLPPYEPAPMTPPRVPGLPQGGYVADSVASGLADALSDTWVASGSALGVPAQAGNGQLTPDAPRP